MLHSEKYHRFYCFSDLPGELWKLHPSSGSESVGGLVGEEGVVLAELGVRHDVDPDVVDDLQDRHRGDRGPEEDVDRRVELRGGPARSAPYRRDFAEILTD